MIGLGSKLAHYEVVSALGKGGMGEVWRARDTKLGREVAIKTLPAEFAQDTDRLARFEREAKLLASLNHPNIASIHGFEEDNGTHFLVMELVEGETLADRLQRGAIPVEESLKSALQMAEALEAAHEKGVVHRDLKPANIKVTADQRIKVLDFGLAKAFAGDETGVDPANSPTLSMQATQQGMILGTAGYMSPEQASGSTADKRADIWAFGVVLLEMLTGRQVFAGNTVSHILAAVLERAPDWNSLPANIHPKIRELLERCLEKDAKDRRQSIGDVRVELQRVLSDPGGVLVEPAAEAVQATPQSKLRWVAAVLVAAVVAGGAVWALMPSPQPGPVVRFPFLLPEGQNFTRPELSMIAVSPDGTRLADVAGGQIHVRNLNETESRPVDGTNAGGFGVAQPVFSPDGEWLAYVEILSQTEGILKRVPVSGGTPVTVFEGGSPFSPSWPTTDTIVFAHQSGIVRVPANGGEPEVLVENTGDEVFDSAQILPGGDAILFAVAEGDPLVSRAAVFTDSTQIVVQSIGADDRTLVWDGGGAPRYLPTGHLVYAQGNTLFGILFDPQQRTVTGGPVPIVEGARRSSTRGSDTANYAVSDTGTLVVIPGTAMAETETVLALVGRNGNVVPLDVPSATYHSPRVSPDGEMLAVEAIDATGQGHIWIYDLSGESTIRRLTQEGNNTRPIWTTDSQMVTFGSERDGSWGIYERPADGATVAERLTTAEDGRRHFPDSWSPDGQTLAYTDADLSNTEWDVWTFSRGSGDSALFVGGAGNQFSAVFSPDGQWLAYTNIQVASIEAQPFPPTGVIHQITDGNEAAPVWTAAGDELFFRPATNSGLQSQIMGMEVTTDDGITFRNRQTLPIEGALMSNGYRDFDITPDGERFVMVYPVESGEPGAPSLSRIDIVLNWTEELLERVPVD